MHTSYCLKKQPWHINILWRVRRIDMVTEIIPTNMIAVDSSTSAVSLEENAIDQRKVVSVRRIVT